MTKAMYQHNGIGLSSNTGRVIILRMFVMDCTRYADKPQVFINPMVVKKSDETLTDFEGCLSAPGKRGEVKRHLRITLNYQR